MWSRNLNFVVACLFLFCGISWALLVDNVREDVIKEIDTAWDQLRKVDRNDKSPTEILKDLARFLKKVPLTISRVERELMIYEYEEPLKALNKLQGVSSHWKKKWSEIAILTSPVDVLYGHFKIFPDMPDTFTPGSDVMDFDASTVTDLILKPIYATDDKGTITLSYLLDHAHSLVVSTHNTKDAFAELNDVINEALKVNNFCLWNGKSPQRILYGFYLSLLALDIKEYTILNFAYMLEYALNGTQNANDISFAKQTIRNKAYEKLISAKTSISEASPAYWQCDPRRHIEGETYEQFKELLQGVIENEKDLHPKGSCKQSCSDFTFTKSKCIDESCVRQRKCTGDIVECKYVAADATACLADAPRRFDYLEYKKGPFLGKTSNGRCEGKTERRDSHWRFLYHCSNCLCLCDDPKSRTTVRHISLAPVTADVQSNKIVTGVRLVMKDKILHLQIEQGVPAKKGYVQEGTSEWKPVPRLYKSDQRNVAMLDYFHRAFNLDDIILGTNYVVTGVRFHEIGEHIGLMVQATQINPITAELIHSTSHWQANDNTPENSKNPRRPLQLDDVDIPTFSTSPSIPDSVHDQYFHFGPTSRTKDVAQTTVPFMDIQPVRPSPAVWLQGVGIYHKGQPGYGGYIAPRVFSTSTAEFLTDSERK